MVKSEIIENGSSYTINIENDDILITITYIDSWYDYQWNMVHKKMEIVIFLKKIQMSGKTGVY